MRKHGRLDAILLGEGVLCMVNKQEKCAVNVRMKTLDGRGEDGGINHQHRSR